MSHHAEIEIDVLLEFRDYLRANYWYLLHRYRLLFVFLFIGGIVYPLLIITGRRSDLLGDNSWAYFIPWVMILLLFVTNYFAAKKHMRSNKPLSEKIHYVFSEQGFNTAASSFSGSTTWQNVFEARETGTNFLIFISNSIMYIVPKRCFRDVEQIQAFKQLVQAQLGPKAKWK
jgi:YcxB-like protein